MDLIVTTRQLHRDVCRLRFSAPVRHVYNPLDYAWPAHETYLTRFGEPPKEVLFVGMNPGPWGMAQTGIPFGEVNMVRDWLQINAPVGRPDQEHPKKPVLGFDCHRSEVSGRRLWGWIRDSFETPERFFRRFFVHNYCPLLFLEQSGRNLTPDRLPAAERAPLEAVCDHALRQTAVVLKARLVIGIGAFAARRARAALADSEVAVGQILHPSPASPAANRGWADQAVRQLREMSVQIP
jgi:single-strand selective monofunctional uracil DNA glycosylase